MKTKTLIQLSCILALQLAVVERACAQFTAFSYQGLLENANGPVNGSYDLTFSLYNNSTGGTLISGPITNLAVGVTNGLFTVTPDFGGAPFKLGESLWLEISARTNAVGSFAMLEPRQAVLSTPVATYAAYASSANASNLIGQVTDANLSTDFTSPHVFSNSANSFTGNGSGLAALNAANLTTGTVADARLSSNVALRAGGNDFTGLQTVTNAGFGFVHGDGNHAVGDYIDSLGARLGTLTDDPLGFFVNSGYPAVTIDTNGFMGIDTITPVAPLEVNGNAQVDGSLQVNSYAAVYGSFYAEGTLYAENSLFADGIMEAANTNGSFGFYGYPGGSGLANGTSLLGSFQTADTNWPQLRFTRSSGGTFMDIGQNANGDFVVEGNDVGRLVVQAAGNVGIGTNAPSSTLEVNGQIAAGSVRAPGAGINTGTFALIQRAVATNTSEDFTTIYNPLCDGDPNAILIVTHNWTADTNSTSQYYTTPVGVYFDGAHWSIFNEDASGMALGHAFNVMIIKH